VVLYISWEAIVGVEELTLYGENGEEIEPVKVNYSALTDGVS